MNHRHWRRACGNWLTERMHGFVYSSICRIFCISFARWLPSQPLAVDPHSIFVIFVAVSSAIQGQSVRLFFCSSLFCIHCVARELRFLFCLNFIDSIKMKKCDRNETDTNHRNKFFSHTLLHLSISLCPLSRCRGLSHSLHQIEGII